MARLVFPNRTQEISSATQSPFAGLGLRIHEWSGEPRGCPDYSDFYS